MLNAIWSWVWPLGLGVVGTVIGWIALRFAGEPIRRFWDMREHVSLILRQYSEFFEGPDPNDEVAIGEAIMGAVWRDDETATRSAAANVFNSRAHEIGAFADNEVLASRLLKIINIRPDFAAALLSSIGEAIIDHDAQTATQHRFSLRTALRLPRDVSGGSNNALCRAQ